GGKKHDIKNATSGGADPRAPVVVLVGEHTASAAEILAGALKQLDRAVLVGRRTFGKGSVQILEDAAHGAKLKITTAEYVAAHDISPQGDGIAPDVELVPAVVPTQIGDVGGELGIVRLAPEQPSRERDLGEALTTTQRPDPDKPRATITYRRVDVDDDPAKDFEVRFARDLAASTTARTRKELLRAVPRVVARARTIAERELVAAFAVLGIDWRPGHSRPTLAAKLDGEVRAQTGSLVTLRGEITNTGTVAAYRVLARASSADPALDGVELAFGMIAPRTTKQATAVVRLPRGATSRASTLTWRVEPTALEATTKVAIAGVPTPRFTLVARLADDNDGIARAGEPLRVRLRISNVGPGRAGKAIATLKSAVGERLLVDRGRLELGAIEPNQSKEVELVFAVKTGLDVPKIALDLVVADANVGASATQKLELALGARVADIKWELTPPKIRVDDVPLETTAEQLRITGSADDEQLVSDLYISTSNRAAKVQERKIFYKAGRASKLAFATDVPLAPGINRILITAREHDVSQTTRTLWVVRR
ncbi:MAG TPA: S41 family peptidase, partial [Kofleriaceae bacterium]|nr:S41 family peptidase [Kofleriaceae bacterium]